VNVSERTSLEAVVRNRIVYVITFALAHVLGTVFLSITAMGAVMKGFEGGPSAAPLSITLLGAALDIASWPLSMVERSSISSAAQYAVLCANGILWAISTLCVWLAIRRARTRLSNRAADASNLP
jgi:hypothetical protein